MGQPTVNSTDTEQQLLSSLLGLPLIIWQCHILPYLSAGPYVEIIAGKPSEEQNERITLTVEQSNAESEEKQTPLVNAYQLIINTGNGGGTTYKIGYCDRDGNYTTHTVVANASLYRYLSHYSIHMEPGQQSVISRDPELLERLEKAIDYIQGLTTNVARDLGCYARVSKDFNLFFGQAVKKLALHSLLDAVAYGGVERAKLILKSRPELLLSKHKGPVTDCAGRRFQSTTALQLAVWNGHGQICQEVLSYIPEGESSYKQDLGAQLTELDNNGLAYTLDNLKACGLRILHSDPPIGVKYDVLAREVYLLIIDDKKNVCIGFRHGETGMYKQCQLDKNSELIQQYVSYLQKSQGIIRDKKILELAKIEIEKHGGRTEITQTTAHYNLAPLRDSCLIYQTYGLSWDLDQSKLYWDEILDWAQRLLPQNMLEEWKERNPCPVNKLLDLCDKMHGFVEDINKEMGRTRNDLNKALDITPTNESWLSQICTML